MVGKPYTGTFFLISDGGSDGVSGGDKLPMMADLDWPVGGRKGWRYPWIWECKVDNVDLSLCLFLAIYAVVPGADASLVAAAVRPLATVKDFAQWLTRVVPWVTRKGCGH